jgi:hypothetical protein
MCGVAASVITVTGGLLLSNTSGSIKQLSLSGLVFCPRESDP